ncbi:MAG TPA: transposase [Puia sp.]|nr:transposase [Puia sp.]
MAIYPKESIRYSISFKQKVVQEVEKGASFVELRRRYGIKGGNTVQQWVRQFGKNHLLNKIVRVEMKGEKDRVKELEEEVKRLKIALADATMAKDLLGTLVDVANRHYKTDLKKNFGPKSLKKTDKPKKDTP